MGQKLEIFKLFGVAALSLNIIACSGTDFSNSSAGITGDKTVLTLKTFLALDEDQRTAAISGVTRDCVEPLPPVEPQPPVSPTDPVEPLPEELTYEQFLRDTGSLGGYWRDAYQCLEVCAFVGSAGRVEAVLVGVENIEQYAAEQDSSDNFPDYIGKCDEPVTIIAPPIADDPTIDPIPRELNR